jgi:hypothetical protein
MSSIDAVVDNMRGKLCPHCYGTIYPGDFHYCPAETSDFTLLRKECDTLQAKLDVVVEAMRALLYVAEMRRNWDILSSDDFDEAYPDECGWAFGDVDENMIQKMEVAQKALAAIEKKRSD